MFLQELYLCESRFEERKFFSDAFVGEGFDDARLDTLFLAMPISWKGTLAQYAGRLHRLHHGKTEMVVYDYVDHLVPTFARMAERRLRGYRALGYEFAGTAPNEQHYDISKNNGIE